MIPGGMGYIIVDALDTMMIMNLTSRVQHARDWIQNSLQYNQDSQVNTYETTIRILGGLLSAHYLSTKYPNLAPISDDDTGSPGEDLYIEKAADLADRLLGAFDSQSGVPFAGVNLNTSEGVASQLNGGVSSTAESTALQLEFKYLAKLTGESEYWQMAEKVMQVVDDQKAEDGLVPVSIHPDGKFRGESISVGSRGDSYYGSSFCYSVIYVAFANTAYRISHQTVSANIRAHLQGHVGPVSDGHSQTSCHVQSTGTADNIGRTTGRNPWLFDAQDGSPGMLPTGNNSSRCYGRLAAVRREEVSRMVTTTGRGNAASSRIDEDMLGDILDNKDGTGTGDCVFRDRPASEDNG